MFQRSSAKVEGRNGYLSLRNHQLRGLDRPRQRECFPAIHHFFLTRPDGTTAAERFFGQKPRAMFAAILDAGELAPAPLSPPRKASSGRSPDRGRQRDMTKPVHVIRSKDTKSCKQSAEENVACIEAEILKQKSQCVTLGVGTPSVHG
ncbi:MAG: DUF6399 domain-containing protein [Candidatus Tectimicrobiota bacterium]